MYVGCRWTLTTKKGILITWINPNKSIELHEDYKKDLAYLPAAAAAAATAAAASTRSGVFFAGSNVATSPNPSPAATSNES